MKSRFLIWSVLFLGLILFYSVQLWAEPDCFSIVVGKDASTTGAVLFAHNEDDSPPQLVNWYKVPRVQHEFAKKYIIKNGAEIPRGSETYAYLWLEMPGMDFSDSYLNEWGVTIASDQCQSREDKPQLSDGGIGYWLRRLMAERARTAKAAVKIGGGLIEKYGYASSGRSYIIADPNEAWVLSAVHGKHWVAQRVPDDQVMVIPNYYTIQQVNLQDTTNFLGSANLVDYAIQRGWYEPETQGDFSFRAVYGAPGSLKTMENIRRMWRGVNLLSEKPYDLSAKFPFSFHPKKKLAKEDLMAVLQDHYEGTPYDLTDGYRYGSPNLTEESTICADANQYGFVAELRADLPVEIGAVLWVAPRRPDIQPFIPWYAGISRIPDGYARADHETALRQHFNLPDDIFEPKPNLAFWGFVKLAEIVDADYLRLQPGIASNKANFQKQLFARQQSFEKDVAEIYPQNRETALKMLNQYTAEIALKAWELVRLEVTQK